MPGLELSAEERTYLKRQSSPESGSGAAFIPRSGTCKPTSAPFIDRHNQNPKPFKWTKSADQILASVKRFCQKTQKTLCGEL